MKRFDLWKLSLLNLFASPVRSMLTVLGFAIGVAAILAVLTLGEAGKQQVESEMGRLGIDRIWLTAAEGSHLTRGTGEWLSQVTGAQGNELVYLPMRLQTGSGKELQATAVGCEQGYLSDSQLTDGRMLLSMEWLMDAPLVLIGERLAKEAGIVPGETVYFLQRSWTVVGIISSGEGVTSVPLEEAVIVPLHKLCRMTNGVVHEIQMGAPQNVSLQSAQKLALQALKTMGISASATTMQVQMEAASNVIFTFVNVLKWVALVCILVGGIGVMNILLVSVRERKREIGVMKSMGAVPAQICMLFLLEALVYAVIGGILGIVTGMGLIHAAGRCIELTARASAGDCITVFFCALGTGIVFGVWPAFRASRLKCVDALRQE